MHIKVIELKVIKVIELEGIVEIDEKEVRFRYFRDDNGSGVYIWNGIQWEDMDYDNPSHVNLSEVCSDTQWSVTI